jgi:hypothetical protein
VQLAHVHAVDPDRAGGGVEQPGHEVHQGGLAGAGAADDRRRLPRPGGEADPGEDRLVGTRVGESGVGHLQLAAPHIAAQGLPRRPHARLRPQHLADPVRGDGGTRDHHCHEGGHHDGHQDLHEVAQERDEGAHLHGPVLDPERAEPDHRHAGHVQHQHHHGERERHQPAGPQRGVRDVLVGLGETRALDVLPDERAHHADAGELLAQDPVHGVDPLLHLPEQRHHPDDDEPHAGEQHGHGDGDQPGQLHVLLDGHDHAADGEHGRGHHHGGAHQHQLLDLLDVVGGPGDQAGRAELGDFLLGELPHPGEDGAPQVPAGAHGRLRAEVHGDHGAGDLQQRDPQHEPAEVEDDAGVPLGHALIDDVRVQRGQVQRRDGLRQLEDDDGDQQLPVRPQVFNKQFPEQCRLQPDTVSTRGGAKVSLRPEAGSPPRLVGWALWKIHRRGLREAEYSALRPQFLQAEGSTADH